MYGFDINDCLFFSLQSGETALISAVSDRRVDEVEVLVQAGADLDIQEEVSAYTWQWTHTVVYIYIHIMWSELLLFQKKGWSAIFFAAEKGDVHIAQLMCGAGASLELLDKVLPRPLYMSL